MKDFFFHFAIKIKQNLKKNVLWQDTHIIDFKEFAQTHTNITVLSLIEPNIYVELEMNLEQNRGSTFLNHNINKVKVTKKLEC